MAVRIVSIDQVPEERAFIIMKEGGTHRSFYGYGQLNRNDRLCIVRFQHLEQGVLKRRLSGRISGHNRVKIPRRRDGILRGGRGTGGQDHNANHVEVYLLCGWVGQHHKEAVFLSGKLSEPSNGHQRQRAGRNSDGNANGQILLQHRYAYIEHLNQRRVVCEHESIFSSGKQRIGAI